MKTIGLQEKIDLYIYVLEMLLSAVQTVVFGVDLVGQAAETSKVACLNTQQHIAIG